MKKLKITYIALCMILCSLPLFGMIVRPTTTTTENRRLSEFPSLFTEKGINLNFFSSFEKYFSEHFAFRNELVAADGKIQGKVFRVSAVDSVVYGSGDWLYYASTTGDYLGTNAMNERELASLQRNLGIVNRWLNGRGITFVYTVPPNKNTLYGTHMPYYDAKKISADHTLYHLKEICNAEGIRYADLYETIKGAGEVLYLKRDSHWNNKGALLAYQTILDTAGHPFDSYANTPANRKKAEDGDLNRMLYSFYGDKEVNYYYEIPADFTYSTDTATVEDGWIETAGPSGTKTLLMFRDSFGNTLIPLIANAFEHGYFTKESPYRLEKTVNEQNPDIVIIERVERSLREFITEPPILSAPVLSDTVSASEEITEDNASLTREENLYDPEFLQLSGTVQSSLLESGTDILLRVNGTVVDAYETGTNGFIAYFNKAEHPANEWTVEVLLKENDIIKTVYRSVIEEGEVK